jgi:hypothetical protein
VYIRYRGFTLILNDLENVNLNIAVMFWMGMPYWRIPARQPDPEVRIIEALKALAEAGEQVVLTTHTISGSLI